MYAVFQTGGKQYRAELGTIVEVESLEGDAGATIELDQVLLVGTDTETKIGRPLVSGAVVVGVILEQKRGPKLTIFKKLRRHGKRLKKGHRQELTRMQVKEIRM